MAENAQVQLVLGTQYDSVVTARRHVLHSDEPPSLGGSDTGPTPWELLLASLASCTAITIRMYAQRKEWTLDTVRVDAERDSSSGAITMRVQIAGPDLDQEACERLEQIAHKCPVVRAVQQGIEIDKQVECRST